jgi:hypothetical protein
MNLLFYENRNVRFEKKLANVVRLNFDSWTYFRFVDVVKTIYENFLQWFIASIAKHVEDVYRERLVKFVFWLRIVSAEYDFANMKKSLTNYRLFVNVH